jgi:hypothetical protein
MANIDILVLDNEFQQSATTGLKGQTVKFKNKRGSSVDIALKDPAGFYSKTEMHLAAKDQPGDEDTCTIDASSGTGGFEAPNGGMVRDTIKGSITVNPGR